MSNFLNTIANNLDTYQSKNAFCIKEQFYTYKEFAQKIAGISEQLVELPAQSNVGVVTTDSIESYASIFALWFSNLVFVPLSPANAKERNLNNIEQANISTVLSPTNVNAENIGLKELNVIETSQLESDVEVKNNNTTPENLLYILFTSGSTGTPKGVPISLNNLNAFVNAFYGIGYAINDEDRFLQIFDFTFDVSVQSYTLPLFKGASVFTVPQTEIKFMSALKILTTHQITFAKLVPSTLHYFKPYFNRINLPHLKYSLFSGEALPYDLAKEWSRCVPNASVENHYGPTEATIDCLYYKLGKSNVESHQDVMSIGEPFNGVDAQIIDGDNQFLNTDKQGELVVNGSQVTSGYLNNPEKNKESFIEIGGKIYYKTGDLVFKNNNNNFFYCGRIDNQIQIQGYRVEIGEIEFQIKKILSKKNIIVTAFTINEALSLALFIEGDEDFDLESFEIKLRKTLPHYMLPKTIKFVSEFPLTTSGKTNVKELKNILSD
ncbi:MAG: AMP-binding protein [Vicingaceae bacterium]|nr:AMP-binding protein [Vicingaceae bacterium]